jgi:hypothetical protein
MIHTFDTFSASLGRMTPVASTYKMAALQYMDKGLSSEFKPIDSLFVMISPRVNSVHLKFHVCFFGPRIWNWLL